MTPEQKEAAWNAYQTFPIDICADHDDEYRKAVIAAVEAALAASHPAPAADTGQAADEAEELRKVLYGFVQGNGDFTAARRLLGDRTYTHHAALRQKEEEA